MRVAGATYRAVHCATHLSRGEHCYHDVRRRRIYVEAGYVSEGDWQAVQAQMGGRVARGDDARRHPRRRGSGYLLSGLLFCSCGAAMNGMAQPRHSNGESTGAWRAGPDALLYYRCGAAQRGQGCTAGMISATAVDEAVMTTVLDRILTSEHLAELRTRLGDELRSGRARLDGEITVLEERRGQVQGSVDRLMDAVKTGGPVADLAAEMRECAQQRDELERQIGVLREERDRQDPRIVGDEEWGGLVAWMREGLQGGDVGQRRAVLGALVERVDLWPGRDGITITYRFMSMERCPHGSADHRPVVRGPLLTLRAPWSFRRRGPRPGYGALAGRS